jgi:hypothetical protein
LRSAVNDRFLPELGRPYDGVGLGFRVIGRIKSGVEDLQPTLKPLITTSWRYQEIARASCSNIGKPHRLGLVSQ